MAGGMGGGGNRQDRSASVAWRPASSRVRTARLTMIETGGWDTHSAQNGRLPNQLRALDSLIAGLREGLGAGWAHTVILVATEFGRTVAANGTGGTDHGTGAVAMLIGGAVQGGRVVADWPGLAPANLFEGRDLKPTLALDVLIASACAETFQLAPERMARVLFPTSARGKPLPRVLRA